ncbi:hypothetical protein PsorP6_009051 [Peronosclerospora sorghi]|uniref:Uncharacterized protein n=1 Tax=Peronosclerospora sorghi TaxID=230839 RepID=A0ACC0VY50_9STRA|nr:hypothetical protein PsorP6_009051 [Peronosclerospora sorghi]
MTVTSPSPIHNVHPLESDGSPGHEPLVKKRRTKNFQLREELAKSRGSVLIHVPAFEPLTFNTWDEFIHAWNSYMECTKTMYRRRSSSTTTYWNNKHKFKKYPVPEDFKYATMAYWCTHGCIQPSRGNGVRTHLHNRYTGCSARITADVVFEMVEGDSSKVRWLVRVRNQVQKECYDRISQHNHRISDEIYNCYTNNSSVPDELLLGPDAQKHELHHGTEESAYESSSRNLAEFDPMGVDSGFSLRSTLESKVDAKSPAASTGLALFVLFVAGFEFHVGVGVAVSGLILKEALANDHKMNMAVSEMQPLLVELRNTPSRVIHKRLQDVSEMVAHLLAKWHEDRIVEEAAQTHGVVPIASLSIDQPATVTNESSDKPSTNTTTSFLPTGPTYYLTPCGEASPDETKQVSPTTECRSSNEAVAASSDRVGSDKSGEDVETQRGQCEDV